MNTELIKQVAEQFYDPIEQIPPFHVSIGWDGRVWVLKLLDDANEVLSVGSCVNDTLIDGCVTYMIVQFMKERLRPTGIEPVTNGM